MAKKPKAAAKNKIDETTLTKMQIRKLNALRKSLGGDIADKAFAEWHAKHGSSAPAPEVDKNAQMITDALGGLVQDKGLRIPRGGYHVTRGRGRVIVTRVRA